MLRVDVAQTTEKYFTLTIFDGDVRLGEYERSIAEQVQRKKDEIGRVEDLLRWVHATHGEFEVRWHSAEKRKEVRVAGRVVTLIPKSCWGDPQLSQRED
jgi:hypothetical protein